MSEDFLSRIEGNLYLQLVFICGLVAFFFYLKLENNKKKDPSFLFPFLLIVVVVFYEALATYVLVNKKLNEQIHYFLTDDPFQGWNVWVYNIFYYQISKLLLLILIMINLKKSLSKKLIRLLGIVFLLFCILTYFSKLISIYEIQPILYFLGNTVLIIGSGLFFIDLITEDYYISINPLKYLPFWYITLILFHSVSLFLADVAFEYLAFENTRVYYIFNAVSMVLYILILIVFNILLFNQSNTISRLAKT